MHRGLAETLSNDILEPIPGQDAMTDLIQPGDTKGGEGEGPV